jgi:hypothetical protein
MSDTKKKIGIGEVIGLAGLQAAEKLCWQKGATAPSAEVINAAAGVVSMVDMHGARVYDVYVSYRKRKEEADESSQ